MAANSERSVESVFESRLGTGENDRSPSVVKEVCLTGMPQDLVRDSGRSELFVAELEEGVSIEETVSVPLLNVRNESRRGFGQADSEAL